MKTGYSRTGSAPMSRGNDGRDHYNKSFSIWMAGGGIQPGTTDALGYAAAENPGRRPRSPRHDDAAPGHQPQKAHLPFPRPRLPTHGRQKPRDGKDSGLGPRAQGPQPGDHAPKSWLHSAGLNPTTPPDGPRTKGLRMRLPFAASRSNTSSEESPGNRSLIFSAR